MYIGLSKCVLLSIIFVFNLHIDSQDKIKKTASDELGFVQKTVRDAVFNITLSATRTHHLLLRRETLYPDEL